MNRGRNILVGILLLIVFLFIKSSEVSAQQLIRPPTYPSCSSYSSQGDYKFVTGHNQVVGLSETVYSNNDIYKLSNQNYVQCVCYLPSQTRGVQVNWWQVDNLSAEEINFFVASGWYAVMGRDWGLDDKKYLAYKANYQCPIIARSGLGVTPTPLPTPTITTNVLSPTPSINKQEIAVTPTVSPIIGGVCAASVPVAPNLLSIKKIEEGCLDVIWSSSVSKVTGYDLKYGTISGQLVRTQIVDGTGTSARLCGLNLDQSVYLAVASRNECALSILSNELSYPKNMTTSGTLADTAGGESVAMGIALVVGGYLVWRGHKNIVRQRSSII